MSAGGSGGPQVAQRRGPALSVEQRLGMSDLPPGVVARGSIVGNSAAPLIAGLNAPQEKGRLLTQPDMRLQNSSNVWAIGDCAWTVNAHSKEPAATTGQFAEREGRQVGENIVRVLNNEPTRPFYFKPVGELCSIGGHQAVADIFGLHLSGFIAWFVWRGVYLFKLPTWGRRFQVGFDWASLLVFPRDWPPCASSRLTA